MLSTKFQPNIQTGSAEKVDITGSAIFSYSGHFGFLARLNFIFLKSNNLGMLHVKPEKHGCSIFREKVV